MQELFSDQEISHLLLMPLDGLMTQVNCPFKVICVQFIGELTEGTVYEVEMVFSTWDEKLVYMIDGKPYYHTHFLVLYGLFSHYCDYIWPNDLPLDF